MKSSVEAVVGPEAVEEAASGQSRDSNSRSQMRNHDQIYGNMDSRTTHDR